MSRFVGCPVQATVTVMGGKWKPAILFRLIDGPMRFSGLDRDMPWMSARVLTRQLRELVEDGVVLRTDHGVKPPHVDYRLTEYGRTLVPLLTRMGDWGQGHLSRRAGLATSDRVDP